MLAAVADVAAAVQHVAWVAVASGVGATLRQRLLGSLLWHEAAWWDGLAMEPPLEAVKGREGGGRGGWPGRGENRAAAPVRVLSPWYSHALRIGTGDTSSYACILRYSTIMLDGERQSSPQRARVPEASYI